MPVTNFPPDLLIITQTNNYSNAGRPRFHTKLITNGDTYLASSSTASETTETTFNNPRFTNTGYDITASGQTTGAYVGYAFKRAPGFFDVVCYKGTGVTGVQDIKHSLGVQPELLITKARTTSSYSDEWFVSCKYLPNSFIDTLHLQSTAAYSANGYDFQNVTASSFGRYLGVSIATEVAYLFATLAGISKVGSYTGNGTSQNIECGFAAGARFVLIKRTDSTGDWYVWDTTRGIVTGNDPHLSLNTTAAEVTTDDSIDPYSPGFTVNQVAATNINVNSATYIFLAIS